MPKLPLWAWLAGGGALLWLLSSRKKSTPDATAAPGTSAPIWQPTTPPPTTADVQGIFATPQQATATYVSPMVGVSQASVAKPQDPTPPPAHFATVNPPLLADINRPTASSIFTVAAAPTLIGGYS